MKTFKKNTLLAVLATAAVTSVSAAPITLFQDDKAGFLAKLATVNSDGLETQTVGSDAVGANRLQLGGMLSGATLTGTVYDYLDDAGAPAKLTGKVGANCQAADKNSAACAGRYNTTAGGSKWWETAIDFGVAFGKATNAFGFNLTDFGDFDGSMLMDLLDGNGNKIGNSILVDRGLDHSNGSQQFFGLTDNGAGFYGISFKVSQRGTDVSSFDYLGFDDLTVGTLRVDSTVPEPTTLALVGLSLAGLALTRRRRS